MSVTFVRWWAVDSTQVGLIPCLTRLCVIVVVIVCVKVFAIVCVNVCINVSVCAPCRPYVLPPVDLPEGGGGDVAHSRPPGGDQGR